MATLGEVYANLPEYRTALHSQKLEMPVATAPAAQAFRGAFSAFTNPLRNVHATGAGIRVRGGKIVADEFVIKVYVFDKVDLGGKTPAITTQFKGIDVDVEHLPIQLALARAAQRKERATAAAQAVPASRQRTRPIVGGVSIAPLDANYVGTLGSFVRRRVADADQVFALSNNHVLADVNRLPVGTKIIQPGPETGASNPADVFAALSEFIPVDFPKGRFGREDNQFDAAIARVTDMGAIKLGKILRIPNYTPVIAEPVPGMEVIKSGRTTGVTTGRVTAVGVHGVQINYGSEATPIIATFNDTIEIVGDGAQPFSLPGDSGSVILEKATGKPVALLFAGDGRTTTACSFGGVCRHFQVEPV